MFLLFSFSLVCLLFFFFFTLSIIPFYSLLFSLNILWFSFRLYILVWLILMFWLLALLIALRFVHVWPSTHNLCLHFYVITLWPVLTIAPSNSANQPTNQHSDGLEMTTRFEPYRQRAATDCKQQTISLGMKKFVVKVLSIT